jgi:hypothetical protein
MRMNGSLTMVVRMPFGVLNVPVAVSTEKITPDPDGMIQSADGCYGPEAEYRAWTTGYLKKPLTFRLGEATTGAHQRPGPDQF